MRTVQRGGALMDTPEGEAPAPAPRFGRTDSSAGGAAVVLDDVRGVWRGFQAATGAMPAGSSR